MDVCFNNEMFRFCGQDLNLQEAGNETGAEDEGYSWKYDDGDADTWFFADDWLDNLKEKLDAVLNE